MLLSICLSVISATNVTVGRCTALAITATQQYGTQLVAQFYIATHNSLDYHSSHMAVYFLKWLLETLT